MTLFMIVLYFILLIVSLLVIVDYYKKEKTINAFFCLQLAFIFYYILIPIVNLTIMNIRTLNQLPGFINLIKEVDSNDVVYAFIYTLISYIIMVLVYKLALSKKKPNIKKKYHAPENIDLFHEDPIDKKVISRFLVSCGIICFLIGSFSELIISYHLGGILKAISMGEVLRNYNIDNSKYIPQNLLFLQSSMVFSLAATYLLYFSLRIKKNKHIQILFFCSICTSLFYLIFNAGRMPILLFVLPFIIDLFFRKTKHPFIYMFFLMFISLFLLEIMDDLFFYLSYGFNKSSSGSLLSTINEFSYPYLNLLNVNKMNSILGLRYGVDYISWIVNIIPFSILNAFGFNKLQSSHELITAYYNSNGGIPTDLLTLGIRQFGLSGVIINSALISVMSKLIDKVIVKIDFKGFSFIILRVSLMMFVILPYADLDSFLRNRLDMLIVFISLIILTKKIKKKKELTS